MEWRRPEIRRLIGALCPADADFDAFVINHAPDVHRRLSAGMDRVQKENLLLQLREPAALARAIREHAEDLALWPLLERHADLAEALRGERATPGDARDRASAAAEPARVLVVSANPDLPGEERLREGREIKAIRDALRVGARGAFNLEVRTAATPADLRRALLDVRPHVLHFSGHGDARPMPEILFEDDRGDPKPVGGDALRNLLGVFHEELRLVVLNACDGRDLARAIVERIDCAIGVHGAIDDDDAILFAGALHEGIEAGRSVRDAFDLGRNAIALDGSRSRPRLELFARDGVDALHVSFGRARAQRSNAISSR